ncbi:DUF3718 domain-containing protein [uncultured Paraglaciecola sp.]|uniref:DUF3718 domain-containing protein n=1 Tax=uncultured Paraglaciecola sp. TaxID=1765024 RepID=UPI0030D89252|tara:strand:- start:565568 stop:565885 length:318 start_codon:yes stop_codon:yes gene_type:complete
MKKIIISSIITAGILLTGSVQASNKIDPTVEGKLVKVCEAIKSDSVIKVNVAIRDSGLGIKQIAKGLVCNGYDSVSFALANEAEKTAKYMAKKSTETHQEMVAKL